MITRRVFSAGAIVAGMTPLMARAATSSVLTADIGALQIAPASYAETAIWRYDLNGVTGTGTGPILGGRQGTRFEVQLQNALAHPTTVHWHGIRLPNPMDGVPGVTQPVVAPGEVFDYAFDLPDAGTYWYHSHVDSVEQIGRGLHGPLIIHEPEPLDIEDDIVLVLDDWRLDDAAALTADFDSRHDQSHAGRLGNVVTTNGDMDWRRKVAKGARLRLRLINVSNARVFDLGRVGLTAWTVAVDGMPLAVPRKTPERVRLAPGQRMDLIVDITAEVGAAAGLVEVIRGEAYAQATFDVMGEGSLRAAAPASLPPNPSYGLPDLTKARPIEVRIEGGAMRGMAEAMSHGVMKDGRTLAQEGLFWALAGQAGRPDAPLVDLSVGETMVIDFVNDTAFAHAMHLHGHHFHEVSKTGALGDFRDTTLVEPGARQRIAMVAYTPGDWLLHCHMLGHHASGMGTWFRVS